jgi:ATP-dependent Zn protease
VIAGLQKKNRGMNSQAKEIIAFHTSGNAIVSDALKHGDSVLKIPIIPR